jgi:hypothetical protein
MTKGAEMVAKISGAHRRAFLRALARTGNVVLAADQVGVSRDWAYKLRRRDAGFAAAFCAAVAEFRNSPVTSLPPLLAHAPRESSSPPERGRGVVLQRGNGRRVQVKRARADQWTEETAARFLTALAGTCNVKMAAAAVGTSATSAFARRRLDPEFARAWAEALEIGYARLEAALIESACCFFEGEVVPDDNPIRTMSVAEAIQSLNMNKFAVKGAGGRPGRPKG